MKSSVGELKVLSKQKCFLFEQICDIQDSDLKISLRNVSSSTALP